MSRHLFRLFSAALVLGVLIGLSYRYWLSTRPLFVTGTDVPDPREAGSPQGAVSRARKLLAAYQASGWNWEAVPESLKHLPDERYIENPQRRSEPAFRHDIQPEYASVAFYTDLYARTNRAWYRGEQQVSHPTGYFLIAWKSGRIEQIPVTQLHELALPGGQSWLLVWPGLPGYAKSPPSDYWKEGSAP